MSRPEPCQHDGGTGIGAGHVCRCVRAAGHPLDSERPHGCSCMALWADTAPAVPCVHAWEWILDDAWLEETLDSCQHCSATRTTKWKATP